MIVPIHRNKEIILAFVKAINDQNWTKLDELVAPNFTRHSHAAGQPGIRSREELKSFLQQEYVTFPDAYECIEDLVAEGDRVAARHHFCGTQQGPMGLYPPTGKKMIADYIAIYRIEDGRIVESWAEWDNLSGLSQLGHYKQDVNNK